MQILDLPSEKTARRRAGRCWSLSGNLPHFWAAKKKN
jgi:hypothetical protein